MFMERQEKPEGETMRRRTKNGWQLSGTNWIGPLLFWSLVLRIIIMFKR